MIVLGIILARAGSKGLPGKCVADLLGQPVIQYTFDHAKEVARKYKLKIPVGQSGAPGKRSQVMARYRTGGTPWVVIIDREGVVRYNAFHVNVDQADKLIRAALKNPPAKGKKFDRSSSPRERQ